MEELDVAIICSAIPARKKLLERSLYTWYRSMLYSELKAKVYLYLEDRQGWLGFNSGQYVPDAFYGDVKYAEQSGSHITGYNYWLDRINAKKYIFTHPDILFPTTTIRTANEACIPNRFVAYKVFWIPPQMTEDMDKYHWRRPEMLESERDLFPPMFSDDHGEFYWNSDVRAKTEWHSTTTWAMEHETLQLLRPFPDFKRQGPDDPYFYGARDRLGIQEYCVMNPILFHQHHPQTWNQDMEDAVMAAGEEIQKRFG